MHKKMHILTEWCVVDNLFGDVHSRSDSSRSSAMPYSFLEREKNQVVMWWCNRWPFVAIITVNCWLITTVLRLRLLYQQKVILHKLCFMSHCDSWSSLFYLLNKAPRDNPLLPSAGKQGLCGNAIFVHNLCLVLCVINKDCWIQAAVFNHVAVNFDAAAVSLLPQPLSIARHTWHIQYLWLALAPHYLWLQLTCSKIYLSKWASQNQWCSIHNPNLPCTIKHAHRF